MPGSIGAPTDPADEIASRREEILELARQHGAHNVRVFGSVARGEADAASDVDFLVDLEPGRSLLDLGGLVMDLADLLRRPVDVVTTRGLRARIRQRVLNEAIPVQRRNDRERLLDILEAIERIDRYAVRGREAFEHDELIQNWITHQLQIIGEAAARITADLRENRPEVPWRQSFQQALDHQPPRWPDPAFPQQFHIDVMVDDIDEAEPKVLALGATRLPGEGPTFRVYADLAGHPFCLCTQ